MQNEKPNIGKNIAELRKQKGVTQDVLAGAVGVSGQAVSKWEVGGYPDIELLQPIADYFGVSIDRLFGRDTTDFGDIEKNILALLAKIPDEGERLRKAFELSWAIEFGCAGLRSNAPDINGAYSRQYSQVMHDSGFTSLGMSNDLRYFLVMPQPEGGWGKVFRYEDAYKKALAIFADENTLKTIFYLYGRSETKSFTPKLLERNLEIAQDNAKIILENLKGYKLIYTSEIDLDDEVITVYNFNPNPAFIPFLTFLGELINRPNSWNCYVGNRHKPYL
jgi:transcriptional regulator with XRE-family HTH domain